MSAPDWLSLYPALSMYAIAERVGIPERRVRATLLAHGVPLAPNGPRRQIDYTKAQELAASGLPLTRVAAQIGCDFSNLYRARRIGTLKVPA